MSNWKTKDKEEIFKAARVKRLSLEKNRVRVIFLPTKEMRRHLNDALNVLEENK